MKKLVNVVMLPTEKATHLFKIDKNISELTYGTPGPADTYYHLYFTTDEEIKDGDWFIPKGDTIVVRHNSNSPAVKLLPGDRKIVATTDPELEISMYKKITEQLSTYQLPKIGLDFVEAYVRAQGKIDEVMLEYEQHQLYIEPDKVMEFTTNPFNKGKSFTTNSDDLFRLKLRSNGTVIISPVNDFKTKEVQAAKLLSKNRIKRLYTEEEVLLLVQNAQLTDDRQMELEHQWDWDKWVRDTLESFKSNKH